jgi:hypothetical protein
VQQPFSEPVQQPAPQVSVDGYRLMGLFQENELQKALISTPSRPSGVWVTLNQNIDGFRLADITRNSVVLEQSGQRLTLQQYVDKQN